MKHVAFALIVLAGSIALASENEEIIWVDVGGAAPNCPFNHLSSITAPQYYFDHYSRHWICAVKFSDFEVTQIPEGPFKPSAESFQYNNGN